MNASTLARIADGITLARNRAALDAARGASGRPAGDERRSLGEVGRSLHRDREAVVATREGHSGHLRRAAGGFAGQVPKARGHHPGADVSPQFKAGLGLILAMAAGSLLYHLVF